MALFGKKKKAEQAAPQPNPEDEIQIVGGDADETDIDDDTSGQVIDFDAIADELGDDDGESEMGDPLNNGSAATLDFSNEAQSETDPFATTPGFETTPTGANAGLNADDELDFDSVFDDGSVAASPTGATVVTPNPFDNALDGGIDIEPVAGAPAVGAQDGTTDAPPLTHTAPMTTADIAASGNAPAVKKSLPLLPLLGAAGLLVALGVVGYVVFGPKNEPEEPISVATNPGLQAPDTGAPSEAAPGEVTPGAPDAVAAPGTSSDGVNPGIAVDGVPIAPGVVVQTAPIGMAPRPTVPLTPTLQKQLKDLWNKGAAAKRAKDFAGARAAWSEMLQKRPYHPGIQEAIDKLPPA